MTPQWKATLRKDSDGNTIVSFSFEGERGHIQMDAPAGNLELDPGDLDGALADQVRRRAKSCIISWRDDAARNRTVEVRVSGGRVLASKRDGAVLGISDERVHGEIGDQDPEWLISHVRSLV